MDTHILVVNDDPFMSRMIAFLLGESAYKSTTLADARRVAGFLAEHPVDLVLLDVMLPYIDGFTLCATLRREHPDTPVIVLSARCAVADRVAGLHAGADDYISKPFEPAELLARIQAVLRRYRRAERNRFGTLVRAGDTALDLGKLQFTAPQRRPVLLTPTEMKILECLMRDANAVVSRATLVERAWGYDTEGDDNRVDVYIRRLRRKIEAEPGKPAYLQTVRGMGYTFRSDGAAARPALVILDSGTCDARDNPRVQRWSASGD